MQNNRVAQWLADFTASDKSRKASILVLAALIPLELYYTFVLYADKPTMQFSTAAISILLILVYVGYATKQAKEDNGFLIYILSHRVTRGIFFLSGGICALYMGSLLIRNAPF